MHHRIRTIFRQSVFDRRLIGQVAFEKSGPLIDRRAMAFYQIIEYPDRVILVKQQLGTDAPDVTGAANDENFHPRKEPPFEEID